MPDVVLRPRRESCVLTLGPAFVSVTGERGVSRSFPRDGNRGAPGAVSRLCARVADGPPGLVLPEIHSLCLLDGRGAVLATLRWDGNDHDALEAGCATARMPLDRVPAGSAPPPGTVGGTAGGATGGAAGRPVRLPAPRRPGPARARRGTARVALALGPRDVTVTGMPAGRPCWPRLGCVPAGGPAVARLRATLFADRPANDPDLLPGPPPGRQRVLGVTLLAAGGSPLAYLTWAGGDLDALRGACALAGIQPEYRWQPRVDTAEFARRGVPVIRASGTPAGRARPPDLPGAGRWWLYTVTLLALAALVVAVTLLST